MNRQTQPSGNIGEDQSDFVEESGQIAESEQQDGHSRSVNIGHWLFVGVLLGIPIVLWAFGLFPRILYVDTVGSIDNLVSMIPTIDLMIIVAIWMAALVIGLMGRRARHVSKANLGG
jgi:hypothetical protein